MFLGSSCCNIAENSTFARPLDFACRLNPSFHAFAEACATETLGAYGRIPFKTPKMPQTCSSPGGYDSNPDGAGWVHTCQKDKSLSINCSGQALVVFSRVARLRKHHIFTSEFLFLPPEKLPTGGDQSTFAADYECIIRTGPDRTPAYCRTSDFPRSETRETVYCR